MELPILFVPKKSDSSGKRKWIVVVDFRKLNDVTVGDSFPIPVISDVLSSLGNPKYFSTVDCASGFWQIPVRAEEAFVNLNDLLTNEPLLKYPDFTRSFVLTTYASNEALGAILSQSPNGQDLPLSYASRTLTRKKITLPQRNKF